MQLMGDLFWYFRTKQKMFGRCPIPTLNHLSLWRSIKSRIDLNGVEALCIEPDLVSPHRVRWVERPTPIGITPSHRPDKNRNGTSVRTLSFTHQALLAPQPSPFHGDPKLRSPYPRRGHHRCSLFFHEHRAKQPFSSPPRPRERCIRIRGRFAPRDCRRWRDIEKSRC